MQKVWYRWALSTRNFPVRIAGLIDETEEEDFLGLVEAKLSKLLSGSWHASLPSVQSMLRRHELFSDVSQTRLESQVPKQGALLASSF